jgi:protein SCO1/2
MRKRRGQLGRISLGVAWAMLCAGAAISPAQDKAVPGSSAVGSPQDVNYHGGLVTPPLPKPSFTLTDTSGAAFDFRGSTDGYVTLLYFGFSHCMTACPMQMNFLAGALRTLPMEVRNQVKVVFVTTDPERDNPRLIRTWLSHFDRSFIGLTGSQAEIQQAETAAKMPRTIKPDEHAAFIVAYTKDNRGHVIYPSGVTQADWIHDLPRLVNETWTTADSSRPYP